MGLCVCVCGGSGCFLLGAYRSVLRGFHTGEVVCCLSGRME
jgi:hypothetical protein